MKFRALILVPLLALLPATVLGRSDVRKSSSRPQKTERSMSAQKDVVVSLCVRVSNVTVRGWDRDEVNVRSLDGAQIQLKRGDTQPSKSAAKLQVVVLDHGDVQRTQSGCQASSDLEVNVPHGATVQVQSTDGDISVEYVATAYVGTQNGNISLEHISDGAEAGSIGGDICIKDATGRMDLNSIGGSVTATDVRSSDSSDTFDITTVSGDIELVQVAHTRLNVRTVNGNMKLIGPLARGGRYGVNTMSGDVTFALPADSSFQLNAKVSSGGDIITDFPLTLLSQSSVRAKPVAPAAVQPPAKTPAPVSPQTPAPRAHPVVTPAPQTKVEPAPPQTKVEPAPAPVIVVAPTAPVVTVKPVITSKKVIRVEPVIVTTPYTLRRVTAVYGTGDAIIFVASFSGTLHLQKN